MRPGCAGGIQYETRIPIHREKKSGSLITIKIHGLKGGHSGAEIHKQRGNAHKMMGRLLYRITKEMPADLVEINGGTKDNVIAMESMAGDPCSRIPGGEGDRHDSRDDRGYGMREFLK